MNVPIVGIRFMTSVLEDRHSHLILTSGQLVYGQMRLMCSVIGKRMQKIPQLL